MADETATTETTATTTATDTTATTAAATTTTTETGGTTIVDGAATEKPVASPATWPEDWRAKLAGEDKNYLKTLDRFADPAALAKAYRELNAKFSSGEYKRNAPPGKDATPEDLAAWRKEQGIPEKPDDYKITPPAGFVFGDADKPILDSLKAYGVANGLTNDAMNKVTSWWASEQEGILARQSEEDSAFKQKAEDVLRTEWGPEFRRNVNAAKSLLATAPEGIADRLVAGRTADGRLIGDDPAILQWLAQLSREMNPAASLVPAGTDNAPKAIDDEIKQIESLMGKRDSEYWKGPKANDLQSRYRELITAREKMSSRAA